MHLFGCVYLRNVKIHHLCQQHHKHPQTSYAIWGLAIAEHRIVSTEPVSLLPNEEGATGRSAQLFLNEVAVMTGRPARCHFRCGTNIRRLFLFWTCSLCTQAASNSFWNRHLSVLKSIPLMSFQGLVWLFLFITVWREEAANVWEFGPMGFIRFSPLNIT